MEMEKRFYSDCVEDERLYVDKTRSIRSLMEPCNVLLLTRPRRFGKTFFLKMLKDFFQLDYQQPGSQEKQKALFSGLAILNEAELCERYMGQFPVVSLSFKDVDGATFEEAAEALAKVLAKAAGEFRFLLESDRIFSGDKESLAKCMDLADYKGPDAWQYHGALRDTARGISQYFGRPVIFLIDDYDEPLLNAWRHGYFQDMKYLMHTVLAPVLDPGPNSECNGLSYHEKAFLTGTFRFDISRRLDTCLSPFVNTPWSDDRPYATMLGFTQAEVDELLERFGLSSRREDVRRQYGGYSFAGLEIYCPWDVIAFCRKARSLPDPKTCQLDNFWNETGSLEHFEEFLQEPMHQGTKELQTLLDGGEICLDRSWKLLQGEFDPHKPWDFWTSLVNTGYLTLGEKCSPPWDYAVRIPNEEIRQAFADGLRKHFSADNVNYAKKGEAIAQAALEGDAEGFKKLLSKTLRNYVFTGDDISRRGTTSDLKSFFEPLLAGAERRGRIAGLRVETVADRATFLFTDPSGAQGVVMELRACGPTEMCQTAQESLDRIQENALFGGGLRFRLQARLGAWYWSERKRGLGEGGSRGAQGPEGLRRLEGQDSRGR